MRELVAMRSSAAANYHPCMEPHLAKGDVLRIDGREVAAAVKVGLMVNQGAENTIRKQARAYGAVSNQDVVPKIPWRRRIGGNDDD